MSKSEKLNSESAARKPLLAHEYWNEVWLKKDRRTVDSPTHFATDYAEYRMTFAMSLITRAADYCANHPPDKNWFRDLYLLTGDHMVLTDEGWEPAYVVKMYRNEDPTWEPIDEVNAPAKAEGGALNDASLSNHHAL